jgi:hypothetical protein
LNALKLDFSQTFPYADGLKTARQHIIDQHMNGPSGKSQYAAPAFLFIANLDRLTMLFGSQQQQGTSIVITLNLLTLPFFPSNYTSGGSIGTDAKGNLTATNRLVILDDCKTVLTSYPIDNLP